MIKAFETEIPLIGKYQVLRELGRGGMGVVYLAEDTRLSRQVALKILHPSLTLDDAFVTRFAGEARAIASLIHPGIVRVHAFEVVSGCQLIEMEYVEGGSLERCMLARTLNRTEALAVVCRVLEALAACHDRDMVHRDVKPSNVLISNDGRVLLSDFGLARTCVGGSSSNTTSSCFIGTPKYAAPESWKGEHPTPAGDVYSAGFVLLELLAGQTPYDGDSPFEILRKTIDTVAIPVRALLPDASAALVTLLEDMLRSDSTLRLPNAGEALARIRMVPEFAEVCTDSTETIRIDSISRQNSDSKRKAWGRVALVIPILIAAVALFNSRTPSPMDQETDAYKIVSTGAGTELVADATLEDPGLTTDVTQPDSDPNAANLVAVGNHAVFIANAGGWRSLWSLDARSGAAKPLWPTLHLEETDDIYGALPVFKGIVAVVRSKKGGLTLFRTDGTPEETLPLAFAASREANRIELLGAQGGTAWFNRIGGDNTFGLWETDGSLEGTRHIWGHRGASIFDVLNLTDAGTLYFGSSNSKEIYALPSGRDEPVLASMDDYTESMAFGGSITIGEQLFIEFNNVVDGAELFLAEPVENSLRPFFEFMPGPAHGLKNTSFTKFGPHVVFVANTPEEGGEPWITDGTLEGTRLLYDVNPGISSSNPYRFCTSGGRLFFSAQTASCGYELWVSDGTTGGTHIVADLGEGPKSGNPYAFLPFQGGLLFTPHETVHGEELWFTDGTPEGTRLVYEFIPGPEGGEPYSPVMMEGRALFIARHPQYGRVVWETDGTTGGTRPLFKKLIRVPMELPELAGWSYFQDKVYMARQTPEYGLELWWTTSDEGEAAFVCDVFPGPQGSNPHNFFRWVSFCISLRMTEFTARSCGAQMVQMRVPCWRATPFLVREVATRGISLRMTRGISPSLLSMGNARRSSPSIAKQRNSFPYPHPSHVRILGNPSICTNTRRSSTASVYKTELVIPHFGKQTGEGPGEFKDSRRGGVSLWIAARSNKTTTQSPRHRGRYEAGLYLCKGLVSTRANMFHYSCGAWTGEVRVVGCC